MVGERPRESERVIKRVKGRACTRARVQEIPKNSDGEKERAEYEKNRELNIIQADLEQLTFTPTAPQWEVVLSVAASVGVTGIDIQVSMHCTSRTPPLPAPSDTAPCYMYIHIYMYKYIYVYVYIYIYTCT